MNLRSLVGRFSSRPAPLSTTSAAPAPAYDPATDPHILADPDLKKLAAESKTAFERTYYNHRGRLAFKWTQYLAFYDQVLSPFVGKEITLVEIGLAEGGSIQLWREYLGPQIRIIGVDCDPKCRAYAEPGVEIILGDQGSSEFLSELALKIGEADIIIDDGSHFSAHQILTFQQLFPVLKVGGTYICEDLHTSYWPGWGGGLGNKDSFIEFIKVTIDRIHARYYGLAVRDDDPCRHMGLIRLVDSIVSIEKMAPKTNYMVHVGGT